MSGDNEDRQAESRRILERIAGEADVDGASATKRPNRPVRTGEGADSEDWAEYWGTKIGRALGLLLLIGLLIWMIRFLMNG
jgi:hypothetical protein